MSPRYPLHHRVRLPFWFLWLALGLGFIPSGLIYLLNIQGTEQFSNLPEMDSLLSGLAKWAPVALVLYIAVIGPIIEEFSFRSWITGKKWGYIVSFLGSLGFVFGSLWENKILLILGILNIIALGFIYFRIQLEHKQNPPFFTGNNTNTKTANPKYIRWYVLLSSLVFGLAHSTEFKGFVPSLLGVLQTGGIGMLFAFFGLRWGFVFSLAAHILWNSIVFVGFGLLMGHSSAKTFEIDTPQHKIVIKPVSFFQDYSSLSEYPAADHSNISKIDASGFWLTELAYRLRPEQNNIFYSTLGGWQSMQKYSMTIEASEGNAIDKNNVFHALLKQLPLITDTVWVYPYRIQISDSTKFSLLVVPIGTHITDFCNELAKQCNTPVFYPQTIRHVHIDNNAMEQLLHQQHQPIQLQQKYYRNHFGFELILDTTETIPWITIKPK